MINIPKMTAEFLCTAEGHKASKAFVESLTAPINEYVAAHSLPRKLGLARTLEPGEQPIYPLKQKPAWILASIGYVAQEFNEDLSYPEVCLPIFAVQASIAWPLRVIDPDVIQDQIEKAAKALMMYEEESFMRTLIPPATNQRILYGPQFGLASAPEQTINLMEGMALEFERRNKVLKYVLISDQDSWGIEDNDKGIIVHELKRLGPEGTWTIYGNKSECGSFRANSEERYNDYPLTHPNTLDNNCKLAEAGEYQMYGLSADVKENFVMPFKESYKCNYDPSLARRQQIGFFGWESLGFGLLDPDCVIMGVVDPKVT
jgi:hypothetical protein